MSQLKKGAILSYITIFLTTTIGLVLTPFIIKSLGDAEYGLYMLIGALVAQVSILNFGLGNTIIRFVSKYRAENDKQKEENFLASILFIYLFISILVVIIGSVVYFNFESIFGNALTVDEIEKGKTMLVILIFNLAISLPGGTFEAVCNAYEQFVFPRALNIIKYVSRAVLIFAILGFIPNALTLVWIDTILNVLIITITTIYAFKKLKLKIKFHYFKATVFKDIFSYSVWVFIYAIVYQLQWQSGQTILGITTDTLTVAIFGIGIMLGSYYGAFAGAINTLLLPRATKMNVNMATETAYTNTIIAVGRINFFLLAAILSGFFLFGKQFILLWVGSIYLPAWEIAILIMIVLTLALLQAFGNSILEAKKKNRFKSVLSLSTMLIAVVSGYYLSFDYGFRGVLYPICFVFFINSIVMSLYYKKIFGFQIKRFIIHTLLKPLLFVLPVVFLFIYLNTFIQIQNWLSFIFSIFLFMTAYIVVMYFFVMNSAEKLILKNLIVKRGN